MTHAHKYRFVVAAILLLAFVLTWWVVLWISRSQEPSTIVMPNGNTIEVEVADTDFLRAKGLSEKTALSIYKGMLFLHDKKEKQSYWMKDMSLPIDIIWIDGETVVGIEENIQPEEGDLSTYKSPQPVDVVLEGTAGFASHHGIKRGDRLDINVQ
jgi:uncharacterized protein